MIEVLAILTPLAIAVLAIVQQRQKKDTDAKLEVIRVDVNSNLTKALDDLEELRLHVGVVEGESLPPPPEERRPS